MQGDLFSPPKKPPTVDEASGVARPEDTAPEEEAFGPPEHVEPDMADDASPAADPGDEENVVATPVTLLGATRGPIRVSLASHAPAQGPRGKGKQNGRGWGKG